MVSPTDVLGALSDDRSLLLFNTIALSNSESSDILASRLNLTRKQYYSRMSKFVKANMVNRRKGKYFLTSLGKIAYDAQTTIGKAVTYYWKLKAIDAVRSDQLPKEEYNDIVNSLIDNEKIKEGLINKSHAKPTKSVTSLHSILLLMIVHVSFLFSPVLSVCSNVSCLS
jgi:hypothetical protein